MLNNDPRATALRRLLRCLRRATRDLATIDLSLSDRPRDHLRLHGPIDRVRVELYRLAEDLGRERTGKEGGDA